MTRPTRMLLIIGILALLGVSALALMARHYGSKLQQPVKSVMDLEPARPVPSESWAEVGRKQASGTDRPVAAPEQRAEPGASEPGTEIAGENGPGPRAERGAGSGAETRSDAPVETGAGSGAPPGGAAEPAPAPRTEVEKFIAVRTFVKQWLDEHPHAAKQFELDVQRLWHLKDRNPMFFRQQINLKTGRARMLSEVGMTEEEYDEVRGSFQTWFDGGEVDPALRTSFERNRERLESLHLGLLEQLEDF